ncbi:xin actin-binding repeat-containing protein 1 [Echeneis naucrates]|uniref:xin actin-binding repeat-containing protein 1 n=1 Tax=Echeneis naucrates TaxID=173247 RepID=UPI0011137D99|nr:xin actin-binding repeat-containing protein 1-like [Echeneis naucrates]
MPAQLSKEELYQQRQKCELRRLLKHTQPELKMLDDAVDKELAEVLSTEPGVTAGETGYEGEVLSRRLIFENSSLSNKQSPFSPKTHMADRAVEGGNVSKTSAVFEKHQERLCNESVIGIVEDEKTLGSCPASHGEDDEEIMRVNVNVTRRIFESQAVKTPEPDVVNKFQGKVFISGDETGPVQKEKHELGLCNNENLRRENKSSVCSESLCLTDLPPKQVPCVHVVGQSPESNFPVGLDVSSGEADFEDDPVSLSGTERCEEIIKTRVALLKNNPFIATNVEKDNASKSQIPGKPSGATEDCLITNVKDRAHLFESMPFDKIRHQNKDEIETMVENIKDTLNTLYHVNALHSDGSIIEVNETMIAKKAKFTLSETGPVIKYDEVAEGGTQNLTLQLLSRANLKPQITYLKEDSKGFMESTVVSVPVHQRQFTTSPDTEFKTANVVQLVEDILNQDNSLRKGVIIQEDANKCAEVTVYALYNYFDEEDVKSYSAPQGPTAEHDEPETEKTNISKTENEKPREGIIKSAISCFLETSQDQACMGSIRPDVTEKGNVKLFKTCIEKGDLQYLKSLQAETIEQEQELTSNRTVAQQNTKLDCQVRDDQSEESSSEWIPVNVKKLKSLFCGEQRRSQEKRNIHESQVQMTTSSHAPSGQTEVRGFEDGPGKQAASECDKKVCHFTVTPQGSHLRLGTQDDNRVHQAEIVQVIDDGDVSNLQNAIHDLQQATLEAKSLYESTQNKQKLVFQQSPQKPVSSVKAQDGKYPEPEAELHQEKENRALESSTEQSCDENHSDHQHADMKPEAVQTTEISSREDRKETDLVQKHIEGVADSSETAQEEGELIFEGKVQAALDSLGRSNVNVSRGDFKAALIYRNSSKPQKARSQNMDMMSAPKQITEDVCPVTESESTQVPLRQEVSKEEVTSAAAEPQSQSVSLNKPAIVPEKRKRSVGPKPALPPKPEHLKGKQGDNQPTNKNPEATQRNAEGADMKKQNEEQTVAQPLTISVSHNEHMKALSKTTTAANSESYSEDHKEGDIQIIHQKTQIHQAQDSSNNTEYTYKRPEEINTTVAAEKPLEKPTADDILNETDETHVDFHEACQIFGGKKTFSLKNAPVKPKRVKMIQSDNKSSQDTSGYHKSALLTHARSKPQQSLTGLSYNGANMSEQTADSKDKHESEITQESKVEMRERKGRTETEDERRQRLSVHMDEIMRGNISAAMEIFDNLRKQEELQSILSRVEEIEQDTSEVDVRSLRRVFEDVPEWVVSSDKMKQKKVKVEHREKKSLLNNENQSKSSMAHVFGDLERASEEIMNLKEQTLARLMDIEEAIKKALYSVSTLKSDSDIVGLSSLFKESLGAKQGSQSSANISKISIESSKTKSIPSIKANTQASSEVASAKQRVSPPSSPAFISIQSAARKTDAAPTETTVCPTCQKSPKTEETFRTTKTLTCNSPAQNKNRDPSKGGPTQSTHSPVNPKRQLSVLEVQTDQDGNSIIGTKTVMENYERTDNKGNQFYSSTTSTTVTTQPESSTSPTGQTAVSLATHQVTTYPEVQLAVNMKP